MPMFVGECCTCEGWRSRSSSTPSWASTTRAAWRTSSTPSSTAPPWGRARRCCADCTRTNPVSLILRSSERDVAQSIACPSLKRSVVGSILLSGPSCSLGYFPFQPVVHNWFIKGRGMYCSVYGKVHIKHPLLLIEKSSLCGGSGFPSKKCVNMTI